MQEFTSSTRMRSHVEYGAFPTNGAKNTNPDEHPNLRNNSLETKDYMKNMRIEIRRVDFVQRMVHIRMQTESGRKEEKHIGFFTSRETYWKYYCNILP
jgi:hypothetical protein